jgi:hypothetical protein
MSKSKIVRSVRWPRPAPRSSSGTGIPRRRLCLLEKPQVSMKIARAGCTQFHLPSHRVDNLRRMRRCQGRQECPLHIQRCAGSVGRIRAEANSDARAIPTTPFSSGWRRTSSTWRRHAGSASSTSMPWCARDTSPGIGTCPPHQPHSREGVVGGATRARRDESRAIASETGDAVDAGGFDGFGEGQIGQDGGEPARQHRLPRPWGAEQ